VIDSVPLKVLFVTLGVLLLLLQPSSRVHAISNPDTLAIVTIRAYDGLVESGDMVFVVYYTIDYASPPTERATEAFLVRFFSGSTELQSTSPYAYVNNGYSDGVVAFYFSSSQVTDLGLVWEGSYTIKVQGSPGLFVVPPVVSSGSIVWVNRLVTMTRFKEHTIGSARDLEVTWAPLTEPDVILVQETPDGPAFTRIGDDYFTNSIPNLRVIAPDLFSSRVASPAFDDRVHDTTYSEGLQTFWDGTSFGRNFDTWANLLGMNRLLLTTLLLIAFNLFVAYISVLILQQTSFAPLTVAVIFPVGAYLGMTDMVLAALMAATSVVATVYILFLKRG